MESPGGPVGPNPALFRHWVHSFEEDTAAARVFRPSDFDFPLARGRSGIELRPDGSVVDWAIAAGDGSEARPAHWIADAAGNVVVIAENGSQQAVASLSEEGKLELVSKTDAQSQAVAQKEREQQAPPVPGQRHTVADEGQFRMPNTGMGAQERPDQ